PAAGAVVGDDLLEHGGEGGRIERFALTHGDGAGSLIVVPGGDDALGIGHDRAVVHKDVDVVLRRQQGANVAVQHEVRTVSAFDGLGDLWVGCVDQLAHLAANGLLPGGQAGDIGVNAWIGYIGHDRFDG